MGRNDTSGNSAVSVNGIVGQPGIADGFGRIPTTHVTFPVSLLDFKPGTNSLRLKGGYVTIVVSGCPYISNGTILSLGTFGTGIELVNGVYTFLITEDDFTNFWVAAGLIDPDLFIFLDGTILQFTAIYSQ
jgi:hypothetical protein